MNYKRGPSYLLALTLLVGAWGPIEAKALSEPERSTVADSAPTSGPRPAVGSYRQRYLSSVAPLIVDCMNDLGWEATYETRHGALLGEVPPSQGMERDAAMTLCVAGSRTHRGIYAD